MPLRPLATATLASLLAMSAVAPARAAAPAADPLAWPTITRENRPATRWWWMGSAVNADDLARELRIFRVAGLGTVEITPIYGVKGREADSIDYLSPRWLEMLGVVTAEAEKLDLDVDMATGTGWCFGGPNVGANDANAVAIYKDGAVTQKPSGVKVKRPAPGGAGPMLNLLHPDAMTRYLERFTEAFSRYKGTLPNAQFHDSYEYKSDWSPDFFDQFAKRRGYDLRGELPALFESAGEPDHVARVKGDYRATVADLVEESIARWTAWSHARGSVTRNQAHGSPGNWLDLYAASDIPETEIDFFKGGEITISKFASSAANTTGKRVVSSETATWSAEHFTETLGALKTICDEFYLAGVNRIMWHGTTYSPADAAWPGWCFYASTELNPRNALWRDVPALHAYLARAQSLLQNGRADNDVLLYWPIHDLWHDAADPKKGRVPGMSVHGDEWFADQPLGKTAKALWENGYAFDYVSDKLLQAAAVEAQVVRLGDGAYRAILVPDCEHIPVATMQKLAALADSGARVIFADRVPQDVPGLADLEKRRAAVRGLAAKFVATPAAELDAALSRSGVRREHALAGLDGVQFARREIDGDTLYFIVNGGKQPLDHSVFLMGAVLSKQAAILDPMTGRIGLAPVTDAGVRLQLDPGQSLFVRPVLAKSTTPVSGTRWAYRDPVGAPFPLTGEWQVTFIDGGPTLPPAARVETLASWTEFGGEAAQSFAGTARYTLRFDAPASPAGATAKSYTLDLGRVVQSARVRLNGADLGTVFKAPYRVTLDALQPAGNVLEIEVTGTSANRVRDLDVRGVQWKIFHDANVLSPSYKPLDASKWSIAAQGLLGPVTLQAQATAD